MDRHLTDRNNNNFRIVTAGLVWVGISQIGMATCQARLAAKKAELASTMEAGQAKLIGGIMVAQMDASVSQVSGIQN